MDDTLGVYAVDLEDGQEWTDLLSVTLTRKQWATTLAALVKQGIEGHELLSELVEKAARGDMLAIAVGPVVQQQVNDIGEATRVVTETILPHVAAEARREHEREKRAADHRKVCPFKDCDYETFHAGKLRIHIRTEHQGTLSN